MPQDDTISSAKTSKTSVSKDLPEHSQWQWFQTPRPVKRLFDRFPIHIYPPNELPQRTATSRAQHTLYIFTTNEGAKSGAPSFNPGCLKWQAYLTFTGLKFTTIPSNNHASPTGALPFLIPPTSSLVFTTESVLPVPSTKLQRWSRERLDRRDDSTVHDGKPSFQLSPEDTRSINGTGSNPVEEPSDMRYDAYISLLDHRIRNAWLYTLYLIPSNFAAVAKPLYILPTSSNPLVHLSLSHTLRAAAEAELLKQSAVIDVGALYRECGSAFSALSELLGDDRYFFSAKDPGLFDASVFAYTHLLLDEGMKWKERRMVDILKGYENLVKHRSRILDEYFPRKSI